MNSINPEKRAKPAFMVSSVQVSPEGNDVSVQMRFCGIGQYVDAKDIVEKQQGWQIDANKTRAGSEMVILIKDSTVMRVVDRIHEIGISSAGGRADIPAPSKTFG